MKKRYIWLAFFSVFILYNCKQNKKIRILSSEKKVNYIDDSNSLILDTCEVWDLSSDEIILILSKSERISVQKKNYCYYALPCEIKGSLYRNDTIFNFIINAGSTIILIYDDSAYYYGCPDSSCLKYFLLAPDDNCFE